MEYTSWENISNFHILVGAFLSSQTRDEITYSAMNRLRNYGLTVSNILQSWKKMLQMEQDKTVNEIQSGANHYADEADRATHEEVFSLEIRTRERERKLLAKIEKSIEDLTNSDYGFCSNPFCGVEIGIRRLEARPTASLCIDCKTLEEISEKQKFGG